MRHGSGDGPEGGFDEAVRARLEEDEDVLAVYAAEVSGPGPGEERTEVGVLLAEGVDEQAREAELRAAVEPLARLGGVGVVVLNRASPEAAYQLLAGARVVLSRDERARVRHQVETIERYFDVASMRWMLANGLRQRLGGQGSGGA